MPLKRTSRRAMLGGVATTLGAARTRPKPADAKAVIAKNAAKPRLKRIKMATVGAPDVAKMEAWYTDWLDYQVVERGVVSGPLAESWSAPGNAGRPYVLLGPASGEDVFVRAVEIDPVPDFKTLTTHGWAAIEITVSDVDKVMDRLQRSPFRIIGPPHALTPTSPIRAMQVIGPAGEVVYLTGNTGDRAASNHPEIKTFIDRIFIMVLAGPDLVVLKKFYLEAFHLGDQGDLAFPVSVLADAQGLPADHIYSLSVLVAAERGNKLELDQYAPQFGVRPGSADQLSPGVAMTTFEANSLDNLAVDFIRPPALLYEGYTAATFFGPAGERTELIAIGQSEE